MIDGSDGDDDDRGVYRGVVDGGNACEEKSCRR